MSKAHRGAGIRALPAHGRGTCPVCKSTRVKVLYEQDFNGKKMNVCKVCKAAVKHGKKQDVTAAL